MRPVDVARGLEADAAQVIRIECQGRAVICADVDDDVSRRELDAGSQMSFTTSRKSLRMVSLVAER